MNDEEKKVIKYQQFQSRQLKRDRKPKRRRAYEEDENSVTNKKKKGDNDNK